jgi:uncharacterized protein YjbI with pentapeptide repeats
MKPTSPEQFEHFPSSSETGAPFSHINSEMMRALTDSNDEFTQDELDKILLEHKYFMDSGGLGGNWETLLVAQLVMGVYYGATNTSGKQADFYNKKLLNLKLQNQNYSTANFIASIGEGVDISFSQMENCIFTDAFWKEANFEGCNLKRTDFSRTDLRNCNFRNCNLDNTDFENCNCEGADFTGASLIGSRFPGAILKNVRY